MFLVLLSFALPLRVVLLVNQQLSSRARYIKGYFCPTNEDLFISARLQLFLGAVDGYVGFHSPGRLCRRFKDARDDFLCRRVMGETILFVRTFWLPVRVRAEPLSLYLGTASSDPDVL